MAMLLPGRQLQPGAPPARSPLLGKSLMRQCQERLAQAVTYPCSLLNLVPYDKRPPLCHHKTPQGLQINGLIIHMAHMPCIVR